MLAIEQNVEIVAKESLLQYRFSTEDVLPSVAEQQVRRYSAERATTLGNGYHSKVNIYFRTADGATKRVYTTIWATDAEFLTLKSGKAIPLRSVLGFDFF